MSAKDTTTIRIKKKTRDLVRSALRRKKSGELETYDDMFKRDYGGKKE